MGAEINVTTADVLCLQPQQNWKSCASKGGLRLYLPARCDMECLHRNMSHGSMPCKMQNIG